jgi:hypothetical protein
MDPNRRKKRKKTDNDEKKSKNRNGSINKATRKLHKISFLTFQITIFVSFCLIQL